MKYLKEYIMQEIMFTPKQMGYETRQELVRCIDCVHCYFAENRVPAEQGYVCEKLGKDVARDWFCADGERKTWE